MSEEIKKAENFEKEKSELEKKYIKNFDEWNILKKDIQEKNNLKQIYVKDRDIWWCSLGVNIGSEIDGKNKLYERPVLIIKKHNKDIVSILPISTKIKNTYYEYIFDYKNKKQSVVLTQLKTIDIKRLDRKIGKIDGAVFDKIKESLFSDIYKYGSRLAAASSDPEGLNKYIISEPNLKSSDSEEYTKKLEVPYHSQFLEVSDSFWNIRSCGGACIKMCLDYFYNTQQKDSLENKKDTNNQVSILEIMKLAKESGGYDMDNGFVHDFAVIYFKENGLESYRKEVSKKSISEKELETEEGYIIRTGLEKEIIFNKIIENIDNNNPVIVSIIKNTLEQTKYHLILVVGYKSENKKITHIIYHEPESTDPSRGAFRECELKVFERSWRGKAIFVSTK